MNQREVGELRRRIRRDRSNMTAIYGCYVNDKKEIVSRFRLPTGIMSENEADRYFGLMKRILSGTLGKNLVDVAFRTAQVEDSPEHKFLMDLRGCALKDEELLSQLYRKIIDTVSMDEGYLILAGCDSYDVPFKSQDGENQSDRSEETYTYLLCGVCPVKQTKGNLHYEAENKEFHDGGISQVAMAPALGFLFPAFDNRGTNLYNALFYTRDSAQGYEELMDSLFHVAMPQPAAQQKSSFEALLAGSLQEACSLEVVQQVHDQLRQAMEMHKEAKVKEPLLVSKEEVKDALQQCGVQEQHIAKFSVDFDETFGFEAQLHPGNIIDKGKFEIRTPDVSIKVAPDRSDLIETRIIGGVKYILISAEENVEVNGVSIHIQEK